MGLGPLSPARAVSLALATTLAWSRPQQTHAAPIDGITARGSALGIGPEPSIAAPTAEDDERDPATEPGPKSRTDSAFDLPVAARSDPYGPRPRGVPVLEVDQILRYALDNPMVQAAQANIEAMKARVRKAKFAWVPIIEASMGLAPGVSIKCDDLQVAAVRPGSAAPTTIDFQYCRPPQADGRDLDVQTAEGYFKQLGEAGIRFQLQLDTVIPIYTFGKLKNLRKTAEAALALTELQKIAIAQETVLRVHQAHTTLLLARSSMAILREAKGVVDRAEARVERDLGGTADDFDADPADVNPDRDPDDLLKVRIARLDLEELMREALKIESLALSGLWALAGQAAPAGFDVADRELKPVVMVGGTRPLGEYKELARQHRPEAKMAAAGVRVRRAQERLARSNFLPDLGVLVSVGVARTTATDQSMRALYYQDNYNFSRVSAALALRWRFDFHLDAFELQAARAEVRAAQSQAEAARTLLGREVEQAYADLTQARATMGLREEAAQEAKRLVVSQELKDTVGGGNAGELLRALEKWYRWRFSRVEAVGDHNLAAAALARAVGTTVWVDAAKPTVRAPAAGP